MSFKRNCQDAVLAAKKIAAGLAERRRKRQIAKLAYLDREATRLYNQVAGSLQSEGVTNEYVVFLERSTRAKIRRDEYAADHGLTDWTPPRRDFHDDWGHEMEADQVPHA